MKLYKKLMTLAAGSMILLTSCYDLDRYPDSQLSSGTFFQNEDHAKMAMMAVYCQMQNDNVFGLAFAWDGLGGISYGYDNPSFQVFQRGTVATTNSYISGKWSALYEGIARANNVLQNVDGCDMSDELKAQYKAEARFMRGLYYFSLLNFYGGVPLYDESVVVSTDFDKMMNPRASEAEVRDFIIKDMDAAIAALPREWDSSNQGRATWGAAVSIKAKVYMYAKKWSEASNLFNEIINCGLYKLYPDYAELFKPGGDESSEMIFAIQNMGGVGTDIGMPMDFYLGTRASYGSCWNNVMPARTFVDTYEWKDGRPFDWDEVIPNFNEDKEVRAKTFYCTLNSGKTAVVEYPEAKETLLAMYEQRDPRMSASIILPYTHYLGWSMNMAVDHEFVLAKGMGIPANYGLINVNSNHEGYLWRKFVAEGDMDGLINNRADTPINFALVRYADVLLMQAECLNELGKQAEAVALINQVRARVNMPGINSGPSYLAATSKDEVFARIRHERAVELACEGHSYFDMKRWGLLEELDGRGEEYITGSKTLYTRKVIERDYLWPIPPTEIEKNESLTQNPGW